MPSKKKAKSSSSKNAAITFTLGPGEYKGGGVGSKMSFHGEIVEEVPAGDFVTGSNGVRTGQIEKFFDELRDRIAQSGGYLPVADSWIVNRIQFTEDLNTIAETLGGIENFFVAYVDEYEVHDGFVGFPEAIRAMRMRKVLSTVPQLNWDDYANAGPSHGENGVPVFDSADSGIFDIVGGSVAGRSRQGSSMDHYGEYGEQLVDGGGAGDANDVFGTPSGNDATWGVGAGHKNGLSQSGDAESVTGTYTGLGGREKVKNFGDVATLFRAAAISQSRNSSGGDPVNLEQKSDEMSNGPSEGFKEEPHTANRSQKRVKHVVDPTNPVSFISGEDPSMSAGRSSSSASSSATLVKPAESLRAQQTLSMPSKQISNSTGGSGRTVSSAQGQSQQATESSEEYPRPQPVHSHLEQLAVSSGGSDASSSTSTITMSTTVTLPKSATRAKPVSKVDQLVAAIRDRLSGIYTDAEVKAYFVKCKKEWGLKSARIPELTDRVVEFILDVNRRELDRPDNKCTICLDPLVGHLSSGPLETAACGHTFHVDCLRRWLQERLSCPLCESFLILETDYPKLGT